MGSGKQRYILKKKNQIYFLQKFQIIFRIALLKQRQLESPLVILINKEK